MLSSGSEKESDPVLFKPMRPHFFKPILQDAIEHGKLAIPKRFVRKYGDELLDSVVLKIPNGTNWPVELTKNDGKIWFGKGFQEFARSYTLKHGNILDFEFENRSSFNVVIFDESATEIDYPCGSVDVAELEETENADTPVSLSDFSRGAGQDQPLLPRDLSHNTNGEVIQQRANAGFVSKTPTFAVVMSAALLKYQQLYLPFSFAEEHLKENEGKVTLQVKGGQSWTLGLTVSHHIRRAYFRINWREFVHGNNLKKGDHIKFELINKQKLVFDVTLTGKTEEVIRGARQGLGSGDEADQVKTLRGASNRHLGVNCETRKTQRLKENESDRLPRASSLTNVEAANKCTSESRFRSIVLALASTPSLNRRKKARKSNVCCRF